MKTTDVKKRIGAFGFYLLVLAITALAGVVGYGMGMVNQTMMESEQQRLEESVVNLRQENDVLNRNLNIMGVDLEVARLANENSQLLLREEMQEQVELRKQLQFYQKVMAPELEQEGFIIDSFNLEPTSSRGYFRFALVLMQQERRRNAVKGTVTITLLGSSEGKREELSIETLLSEWSDNLSFSFMYFDIVRGEFALPDKFIPEQIQVDAKLANSPWGKNSLSRVFDWELPVNP